MPPLSSRPPSKGLIQSHLLLKAPAQLAILYNESPPSYLAGEQIEQQGSNTNDLVLQMDDRLLLPPALATLVIEQPCQCTVGGRGVSAVIEHSTRNTSRPTRVVWALGILRARPPNYHPASPYRILRYGQLGAQRYLSGKWFGRPKQFAACQL